MYIELPWIDPRSLGNAVFTIRSTSCSIVTIGLYKAAPDQTIDKRDHIHKHPSNILNRIAVLRKPGCGFTCEIYYLLITGTRCRWDRYCGGDWDSCGSVLGKEATAII